MRTWAVGVAVLAAAALAGCGGGEDSGGEGTSLGGPDSDCPLPVTFRVPDGWSAEPVSAEEAKAMAKTFDSDFALPGPFRLACMLEHTDDIGYVHVYVGPRIPPEEAESALVAFTDDSGGQE